MFYENYLGLFQTRAGINGTFNIHSWPSIFPQKVTFPWDYIPITFLGLDISLPSFGLLSTVHVHPTTLKVHWKLSGKKANFIPKVLKSYSLEAVPPWSAIVHLVDIPLWSLRLYLQRPHCTKVLQFSLFLPFCYTEGHQF